jgi:hypothetical protein
MSVNLTIYQLAHEPRSPRRYRIYYKRISPQWRICSSIHNLQTLFQHVAAVATLDIAACGKFDRRKPVMELQPAVQ